MISTSNGQKVPHLIHILCPRKRHHILKVKIIHSLSTYVIAWYLKTNIVQEIFAYMFPDKFGNKDVTNNCWFTWSFFYH